MIAAGPHLSRDCSAIRSCRLVLPLLVALFARTLTAMEAAAELRGPANVAQALTIHHIAGERTRALLA